MAIVVRRRWAGYHNLPCLPKETIERLKAVSAHNRRVLDDGQPTDSPATQGRAGWIEIGGKRNFYRSLWEMNYACWLEYRRVTLGDIKDWEYEPVTFWFDGIKRGVCSYKPDFRITLHDGSSYFDEVKGYMDPRSKTKLKRMAKYHPHVTVNVIGATWFKQHRGLAVIVPGWQRG